MVFQTEKALKEVGDKLDAADKSSVEADVQALKDILAKSTPEDTSDAQVAEIKAAKRQPDGKCTETVHKDVRAGRRSRSRGCRRTDTGGWVLHRKDSREMT